MTVISKFKDDGILVVVERVELTDERVANHLKATREDKRTVMLKDPYGRVFGKPVHNKLFQDEGGWYVRRGKRGGIKEYIQDCEITSFDNEPSLFQFRLKSTVEYLAQEAARYDAKYGTNDA